MNLGGFLKLLIDLYPNLEIYKEVLGPAHCGKIRAWPKSFGHEEGI